MGDGERPGSFKVGDYGVGVSGEIGCSPGETGFLVSEMCGELNEYVGDISQTLTIAAWAHAQLVDIHPFADGNGRTSRLLMNVLLMNGGLPPVTIDPADRISYYGALDAYHEERELDPFREFVKAQLVKTWYSVLIGIGDAGAHDLKPRQGL